MNTITLNCNCGSTTATVIDAQTTWAMAICDGCSIATSTLDIQVMCQTPTLY